MEILPFTREHIPAAAELFIRGLRKLRQCVPDLPEDMEDPNRVAEKLEILLAAAPGVAAVEGDRLVGYLCNWIVPEFRDTPRTGAYCPEWGHAAEEEQQAAIYRKLYRAAARNWSEAGCQVETLTLLAHDRAALETWFWNGFGLLLVDAVRSMQPLDLPARPDFTVRKATPADVGRLAEIEAEHWQHYRQPPVLMMVGHPDTAEGFAELLSNSQNSAWLAEEDGTVMGYMRFEARSPGAATIVRSESSVAITGAFTRPAYRGRGAAPALLDAALRDYAAQGYRRCSVDFESFNPEAAVFWTRYFQPVCYSVTRIPELV